MRDIPPVPAVPANNEPTDMLRRRPDIIAAERRLAASNERIGAAISDYYPKFSLSGALGFETVSNHLFSIASIPSRSAAVRSAGGCSTSARLTPKLRRPRAATPKRWRCTGSRC